MSFSAGIVIPFLVSWTAGHDRFSARLHDPSPEDAAREFLIQFYPSDDTLRYARMLFWVVVCG